MVHLCGMTQWLRGPSAVKTKILILVILACCCVGFYFWYRSLRPSSADPGTFPISLTGFSIELTKFPPDRVDVYGTKRENGRSYAYLVANKVLITEFQYGYPHRATLAVNPLQAYRILAAQKEGTLSLAWRISRKIDETNVRDAVITFEELLRETSEPVPAPRDP